MRLCLAWIENLRPAQLSLLAIFWFGVIFGYLGGFLFNYFGGCLIQQDGWDTFLFCLSTVTAIATVLMSGFLYLDHKASRRYQAI